MVAQSAWPVLVRSPFVLFWHPCWLLLCLRMAHWLHPFVFLNTLNTLKTFNTMNTLNALNTLWLHLIYFASITKRAKQIKLLPGQFKKGCAAHYWLQWSIVKKLVEVFLTRIDSTYNYMIQCYPIFFMVKNVENERQRNRGSCMKYLQRLAFSKLRYIRSLYLTKY